MHSIQEELGKRLRGGPLVWNGEEWRLVGLGVISRFSLMDCIRRRYPRSTAQAWQTLRDMEAQAPIVEGAEA